MNPFFSIITPVYNRENIVAKTIESVLNQEFQDFELILVDDCSSDNSLEVLRSWEKKDQRIKVLALENNEGRCFARNAGLDLAKGKWVCYLDSDDLYYPNHLTVMKNSITEHPDSLAFATDQHINGILKEYRRSELHKDNICLQLNDFIEDNPLTANQLCHSRNLDVHWPGKRIPISEDWLFLRTVAIKTGIFKRSIVTNNLIDHSDRSMNTTGASEFVKYNLIAAQTFIDENEIPKNTANRIIVYTNLLCANVLLNSNQKKEAYKIFKSCVTYPKAYTYKLFYKALLKFIIR